MNVSVRRPVCTQRHTCSTAARQRPRVTSECVKINDVRLLDFQTGPVNFRIRHQITGADHVVHAKFLRKCNPEEVWDNAHDVQESNSVSDSDSDADFHVVARNIPPDVLADLSSNGAPPSPPRSTLLSQILHCHTFLMFLMTLLKMLFVYRSLFCFHLKSFHSI